MKTHLRSYMEHQRRRVMSIILLICFHYYKADMKKFYKDTKQKSRFFSFDKKELAIYIILTLLIVSFIAIMIN